MTTKELTRRLQYYSSLDNAACYFQDPDNDFVFSITRVIDGKKDLFYSLSYIFYVDDSLQYAMIERFTLSQFKVQLGYFRSFFNRASKTQQDYIKNSNLVPNLLKIQL